jgi:hypothetical protein
MKKVLADLAVLSQSGILSEERLLNWNDVLTFLLLREAMTKFQVQLWITREERIGVEYTVSDDGTLHEDSDSGGIDYFALPSGTTASVTIGLRDGCAALEEVKEFLKQRGFTFNGSFISGDVSRDRAYSTDSYGLIRGKVGRWP